MIIDSHCHILPPSFPLRHAELAAADATYRALFPTPGARMATAETLLGAMDDSGVDHAVVAGFGWDNPAVAREVNDYISDAVGNSGGRLTGFCSVNPAWGKAALGELERCAALGLRGIGELHADSQGFDITDEAVMAPVMELARDLGMPMLVHASEPAGHHYAGKGTTTPDRLYRFIKAFPDNFIIGAHWGGGLPFYGLMPEVPGELANAYFDSAASPFLYKPEIFEVVAGTIGAEKILFATDFPLIRHRRLLRQVQQANLDASAKEAILGANAARLLGLTRMAKEAGGSCPGATNHGH